MKINKISYLGGDVFSVDVEGVILKIDNLTLHRLNLSPGVGVSGDVFAELVQTSDFISAKQYVVASLSRHASSRSMMERKLMQKGFSPRVRGDVLDFYEKVGLIDDGLFASNYAKSASSSKNYGKSRIKAELKKRGVKNEAIDAALDGVDDTDALREALRKELKKISAADATAVEKLRRRLYMKGFNIRDINRCLGDIGGEYED